MKDSHETRIGDVTGRPGADDERAVELDLEPAPEFFMVGEGAPYAVNPRADVHGLHNAVRIAFNGHDYILRNWQLYGCQYGAGAK